MRWRQRGRGHRAQHDAVGERQLERGLREALGIGAGADDLGRPQPQVERVEQRDMAEQILPGRRQDALDQPVDIWYRPYDLSEGTEAKMREYLTWEVGLTDAIARDGTTRFREFPDSRNGERAGT